MFPDNVYSIVSKECVDLITGVSLFFVFIFLENNNESDCVLILVVIVIFLFHIFLFFLKKNHLVAGQISFS